MAGILRAVAAIIVLLWLLGLPFDIAGNPIHFLFVLAAGVIIGNLSPPGGPSAKGEDPAPDAMKGRGADRCRHRSAIHPPPRAPLSSRCRPVRPVRR